MLVAAILAPLAAPVERVAGQRGGPPPTGTALLAGQVIESPSGRPIDNAVVTLSGGAPLPVLTDARGRFAFPGLRAGTVIAIAAKPGFAPVLPLVRGIALQDGQRVTDVRLRLVRLASVSGAVRDDAGDPIVGTEVIVFRRAIVNGRPEIRRAGDATTDDRGMYRVFNLPPGEVVVCACRRDPIPLDGVLLKTLAAEPSQLIAAAAQALRLGADAVALDDTLRTFPPTFHPSSTTASGAARVLLAPGEDRAAVDITIVPARARRISGTIAGAPGPLHASSIRLVPAGEGGQFASLAPLVPALVQPGGRFDFSGVPPGTYVLRVTHSETQGGPGGPSGAALAFIGSRGAVLASPGASVPAAPQYWAEEQVVVGDDDVAGLRVALREGPRLVGRVQFAGSASPPDPKVVSSRALVRVEMTGSNPTFTGWQPMGRVAGDGAFSLSALPGSHYLLATGVPGWPTLKSITIAGVDVTDLPIEIGARDITDIVVTFSDAPTSSMAGSVAGGRAPADESVVLIFPADRRLWRDPGAARRRFRNIPVMRDGSLPPTTLPPGEYFVAVVAEDAALEWQEATRLETLAKTAQRVSLGEAEKKVVEVRR